MNDHGKFWISELGRWSQRSHLTVEGEALSSNVVDIFWLWNNIGQRFIFRADGRWGENLRTTWGRGFALIVVEFALEGNVLVSNGWVFRCHTDEVTVSLQQWHTFSWSSVIHEMEGQLSDPFDEIVSYFWCSFWIQYTLLMQCKLWIDTRQIMLHNFAQTTCAASCFWNLFGCAPIPTVGERPCLDQLW